MSDRHLRNKNENTRGPDAKQTRQAIDLVKAGQDAKLDRAIVETNRKGGK